jgi:CMP-N-acetylneuraminic acid synthetase
MSGANEPETLAVIPARGGSRAVPRKNLAPVAGRPLIAYTIDAALGCPDLARTIVSTDDPEIADEARAMGCEIPYLRPSELATETTPTVDVVIHALDQLKTAERYVPEIVVILQPTSPLRAEHDISCALKILGEDAVDAVVAVTLASTHPEWTFTVGQDGFLTRYLPTISPTTRRQDLPPAYAPNGAVFVIRRGALLEERTLYPRRTVAYVMPPERSLDIDDSWDLHVADLVLREMR